MSGKASPGKPEMTVLSAEQQEKLLQFKIQTRIDNEKYLSSHPEVEVLIGDFLRDVLLQRPADIREFAADHFTNPKLQLATVSKMEGRSEMECQEATNTHDNNTALSS